MSGTSPGPLMSTPSQVIALKIGPEFPWNLLSHKVIMIFGTSLWKEINSKSPLWNGHSQVSSSFQARKLYSPCCQEGFLIAVALPLVELMREYKPIFCHKRPYLCRLAFLRSMQECSFLNGTNMSVRQSSLFTLYHKDFRVKSFSCENLFLWVKSS